jgi:(p)ppGpp synthase/HD superfamily hydrolase
MSELIGQTKTLHTFEEVQELFYPYINNAEDRQLIQRAYEFAGVSTGASCGNRRTLYPHLIEVAYILARLQAGPSPSPPGYSTTW